MLMSSAAMAKQITVINYGGEVAQAMRPSFVKPFEKDTNISVITGSYAGGQAKVKAMVEAHHVTWNAVEIEADDLDRGCSRGLYEHIDWSTITHKSQLEPSAVTPCGVGIFKWATVLAYDTDSVKGKPHGWKDFWNVKKYPGKRGLRKTARGTLEFALLADGVPESKVYSVLATHAGVARAFRKLDQLRPHIIWWQAGAQPQQLLESGSVAMSSAFVGRIIAAEKAGQPLGITWNGAIGAYDYWAIPAGAPNKKLTERFIDYTVGVEPQLKFISRLPTGPANRATLTKMTKSQLALIPNAPDHAGGILETSAKFWLQHGAYLDQRFAAWLSQ